MSSQSDLQWEQFIVSSPIWATNSLAVQGSQVVEFSPCVKNKLIFEMPIPDNCHNYHNALVVQFSVFSSLFHEDYITLLYTQCKIFTHSFVARQLLSQI